MQHLSYHAPPIASTLLPLFPSASSRLIEVFVFLKNDQAYCRGAEMDVKCLSNIHTLSSLLLLKDRL